MKLLQECETVSVTSKNGITRNRKMGLFQCPECGNAVKKPLDNGSKSKTCGAKGCKETTKPKHNHAGTKLYTIWNNIRLRCDKPTQKAYKHYGGKGIGYPDHWKTFEGFFMDMGFTYQEGLSIDRIDSSKSYSKENCRWVPIEDNVAKEKQKPVAKYTLDNEFICSYKSVEAATKAEGHKFNSSISRVARGERKQYKGFIWKYI